MADRRAQRSVGKLKTEFILALLSKNEGRTFMHPKTGNPTTTDILRIGTFGRRRVLGYIKVGLVGAP